MRGTGFLIMLLSVIYSLVSRSLKPGKSTQDPSSLGGGGPVEAVSLGSRGEQSSSSSAGPALGDCRQALLVVPS